MRLAVLTGLLLVVSTGATAQDVQPTEAQTCELHVWASDGLSKTRQRASDNLSTGYMGALGSSPVGRIERNTAEVNTQNAKPGGPLPTLRQLEILSEADLPALFGFDAYKVVTHEKPLPSGLIRSVKTRYTRGAPECYAELVVTDVVYSREYARGQNLKSFFRLRVFDKGGERPVRVLGTWTQTNLKHDQEKTDVEQVTYELDMEAAFKQNLSDFAALIQDIPSNNR
ncbi:hypothetical protein GCM10023115_11190 [Pontixanthobacter gangjinensis]|uniref:Uncharacterized protein n=1 Tax=Pontixanthobacter gangjinensis TaxID=1028742 RepID=A0A6I4SKX6_9SPHN|nr:hypothetical protein [Pontixanthobacter gangjinensis]MXO56365.1 hypothetical protein [Pontixanthobacter gangjinensis]